MSRPSDPRRRQNPVPAAPSPRAAHSHGTPARDQPGRPPRPEPAARRTRAVGQSTLWSDPDRAPQPLRAAWTPIPAQDATPGATKLKPRRPAAEPPAGHDRSTRRKSPRRRSALGWFVHRYGWRAYALPVLVALTVVVVVQVAQGPVSSVLAEQAKTTVPVSATTAGATTSQAFNPAPTQASVAGPPPSTVVITTTRIAANSPSVSALPVAPTVSGASGSLGPDPNGSYAKNLKTGFLPAGAAFTARGDGHFHIVAGSGAALGKGPKKLTFTIEVEGGIESTADDQLFADRVVSILSDPRSWIGSGKYTLQRVDTGTPDFRVSLTSQMGVRTFCGYQIKIEASCFNKSEDNRVFINDSRWVRGAISFNGDLDLYRQYAINHEVGHKLGFHHEPCAKQGGLAPVMMQQTFSTSNDELSPLDPQHILADGLTCTANPYPYPQASTG